MGENKNTRRDNPSVIKKLFNPMVRLFEWIAKGQTADPLCNG
jgi:hypothetical protein